MKLSIVSLNFIKKELTMQCMESLYAVYSEEFKKNEFEFIVVDNASGNNSVEVLENFIKKNNYKNFQVIANKKNAGFGGGNNAGAAQAKAKYLLFLNNDTQVKDNGVADMVSYLEKNPSIAILGGPLKNTDGTPQPSSGKFYTLISALMLLLGFQRFGFLDQSPSTIEKVDWVKGALLMIKKDVFEKLGGFDEKIFMYTEDMELCYRAHKSGYAVYFYPYVSVLHKDQGSSNRTFAIVNIYKNILYFYKKHRSFGEYVFISFLLKSKAILLIIIGKILHNTYLTTTYEQALAVL